MSTRRRIQVVRLTTSRNDVNLHEHNGVIGSAIIGCVLLIDDGVFGLDSVVPTDLVWNPNSGLLYFYKEKNRIGFTIRV